MKNIMTLIAILLLATSSFAAEITEADVKAFLVSWLTAQNTGSYSNYVAMYSDSFTGIRRTGSHTYNFSRDSWLKDRKKMFKKKMVVTAINPVIQRSETTATVKFEQTWASGAYKDKGDKLLKLVTENGKLKIIWEEMLFSKVVLNKKQDQRKYVSKFTSIKDKDCKTIHSDNMILFFGSESVVECPAPKGWRIFKEYDREEIRSWISISNNNSIWTTVNQVWGDERYEFGHFPSVDNKFVEWRTSITGEPSALIFRVNAQDPEKSSTILTRLFVIRFVNKIPRFCGIAKTNEDANEIADNSTSCTTILEKKTLPK